MQDHPRALRWQIAATLAISFALFTGAAPAQEEKLPPGAKVVRIEATPPAVTLKNPFDYAARAPALVNSLRRYNYQISETGATPVLQKITVQPASVAVYDSDISSVPHVPFQFRQIGKCCAL